jgi:NitT/TauT family transport system substrate-binding protein
VTTATPLKRTAFLSGCAAALALPALPARAQANSKINIGTVAIDALAVPFYAQDMGFFAKAGLDVTISQVNNGAAVTAGVVGGAYDIGGSNIGSLIIASSKGLPITLVTPAGEYNGREALLGILVTKSSPIKTAKDLEGKIIGTTPLGNIGQYVADNWVDKNGGDSTKLKWVEISFAETEAALVAGRIDAAVVSEPFVTQIRTVGRMLAAPYAAVAPRFQTTAYFSSKQWTQANPQLLARYITVIRETAAWANKNQQKSGDILAKYSKIDRDLIARMSRIHYGEDLVPSLLQPTIELMARYKAIDAPFSADTFLYHPH